MLSFLIYDYAMYQLIVISAILRYEATKNNDYRIDYIL